jgi:hypothetical protein
MTQRKEKDIIDFMIEINRVWQLSINEKSFLEGILELILKPSKTTFNLVESALDEDYPMLLTYIPNHYIEDYATDYLDMIDEDDCKSDLGDFSDRKVLEECQKRGYTDLIDNEPYYDNVDESLLSDVKEVFDRLNVFERQELRDLVLNFGKRGTSA